MSLSVGPHCHLKVIEQLELNNNNTFYFLDAYQNTQGYNKWSQGKKQFLNVWILSSDFKSAGESIFLILEGKEFHSQGAEQLKGP